MKKILLVLFFLLSQGARSQVVAVLGDSLSTGAGTHPSLHFDANLLAKVFEGQIDIRPDQRHIPGDLDDAPLVTPRVLWPGSRDFAGGMPWFSRHLIHAASRLYLNTEEYSWASLIQRSSARMNGSLMIAAENGARTADISRQYDRVLEATGGRRPETLFVFFSGNDLCGPSADFILGAEDYEAQLRRGLSYLARNGDGPMQVRVLGFLGVMQLVYSEAIGKRKVRAFGEDTTCKALRERGFVAKEPNEPSTIWSLILPPNPAMICPTIFAPGQKDGRATLANRVREFQTRQQKVITELSQQNLPNLDFQLIDATSKIIFTGEDVADDCFHLSISGQAKIAKAVQVGITKTPKPPALAP